MPEIYLFNLDNQRYGLRKEEIEDVLEVAAVHRLPFSPPFIVGLTAIEKRNTALADLAGLLNHRGFDPEGPGQVIMLAGLNEGTAFVLSAPLNLAGFSDQEITPLPTHLSSPWIADCLIVEGYPLPLLNLREIYCHLLTTKAAKPLPFLSRLTSPALSDAATPGADLRLFTGNSGELFALPAACAGPAVAQPARTARLLLADRQFLGAIYLEGQGVVPLLKTDWLSVRRHPADPDPGLVLLVRINGLDFGVPIREDLGIVKGDARQCRDLPSLLVNSVVDFLFYRQQKIIPVLAPARLLPSPPEASPAKLNLQPDSTFAARFGRQEVMIREFSLLGATHAVPDAEIEDVVPLAPVRALPVSTSLVVGIAAYQNDLLPVLDVAMVFGRRSLVDRNWQMILIRNGHFRGFILAGNVSASTVLPRDSQKKVPINLRENLVYGCYPDAGGVRLILNIAALAACFDKLLVREFISTMTPEMLEAPARLVPELLGGDNPDQVAAAETATAPPPILDTPPAADVPPASTPTLTLAEELEHQLQLEDDPAANPSACLDNYSVPVSFEEEQLQVPIDPLPEKSADRDQIEQTTPAPDSSPVPIINLEIAAPDERFPVPAMLDGHDSPAAHTAGGIAAAEKIPADSFTRKVAEARLELARLVAEREERQKPDEPEPSGSEKTEDTVREEKRPASPRIEPPNRKKSAGETAAKELQHEDGPKLKSRTGSQSGLREITAGKPENIPVDGSRPDYPVSAAPALTDSLARIAPSAEKRDWPQPPRPARVAARSRRQLLTRIFIWLVIMVLFNVWLFYDLHRAQKSQYQPIPALPEQRQESPLPAETKKTAPPSPPGEPAALRQEPPGRELVLVVPDDIPIKSGIYEIEEGDTLWGITRKFTGDPYNYPLVARDNSIPNPDLIYPRQKIILKRKEPRN